MRLVVIGATGMVGTRVTAEALRRGHEVTGVARRPPAPACDHPGAAWVPADVSEVAGLAPVLHGADAAVLTVRPAPGAEATLGPLTAGVLAAAARAGTRLVVVGGAGPLRSPDRPGLLVLDDPTWVAPEWRALAAASTDQLRTCRRHDDVDWTYLSPSALLAPGARTGHYRRGTATLLVDGGGRSHISAEDLAVAVVDELERPTGVRHLTVGYWPTPRGRLDP